MLAKINSCTVLGVDGWIVQVEVDVARGLPVFATVGLPDSIVKESKDRVKAAIKNCGYEFPAKRITVNLAPADLKKIGSGFDLPIALGVLMADRTLTPQKDIQHFCFTGELSLDGGVRPVKGILPMLMTAIENGIKNALIPLENLQEARLVESDITLLPIATLQDGVEFLAGYKDLELPSFPENISEKVNHKVEVDFSDIKGQHSAKRAMEIVAAGNHNALFIGPPGAGKTMLARRLPTILPPMVKEEIFETTKIYSVSTKGSDRATVAGERPFRSPHHTISDAGLIGGGAVPQPGEVSLAHNGVLFLDELPEFRKNVLEVLRQPLEDGEVSIARANMTLTFPAKFILVAAMNPCKCGYHGDERNRCICSDSEIKKYTSKISGPLLDRIDIKIEVKAIDISEISSSAAGESSATIRKRVVRARNRQSERFKGIKNVHCNGQMNGRMIDRFCSLDKKNKALLERSADKLGLSARAYYRTLRMARTISDLDDSEDIRSAHVAEAVQLCRLKL